MIPLLPPKRNGPLKIVEGTWEPMQRSQFLSSNTPGCVNTPFKLKVEDEDLTDTVTSRWFIDKMNTSTAYDASPVRSGTQIRSVTAPTALSFSTALANLPIGTHLLTVFVADSSFDGQGVDGEVQVSREPVQLADGGVVLDKGTLDSFTWVLDVVKCP